MKKSTCQEQNIKIVFYHYFQILICSLSKIVIAIITNININFNKTVYKFKNLMKLLNAFKPLYALKYLQVCIN